MIKLKTDCNTCIHSEVCKNKDAVMSTFHYSAPDEIKWNEIKWTDMFNNLRIDVEFSCPDYMEITRW